MKLRKVEEGIGMERGACFDSTGQYRYALWRRWQVQAPQLVFLMLNPSTADSMVDDPTIRRCIGFAQDWDYGAVEVVNLFGLRTPHPQQLRTAADPVGLECDAYILRAVQQADCVVVAWGNWGYLHGRDRVVLEMLCSIQRPYCLGLNQSGQPRHPLYLSRMAKPMPYPVISIR